MIPKPYKGMAMEGLIATWYAKNTLPDMEEYRSLARTIAARLRPGARILEVAPGPGYTAIELARLGSFRVSGMDISSTFVSIARRNAARAGSPRSSSAETLAPCPGRTTSSTSLSAGRLSRTSRSRSAPCWRCTGC